jgi:hypothetical protein
MDMNNFESIKDSKELAKESLILNLATVEVLEEATKRSNSHLAAAADNDHYMERSSKQSRTVIAPKNSKSYLQMTPDSCFKTSPRSLDELTSTKYKQFENELKVRRYE